MQIVFKVLAVVLLGTAAFLLWQNNPEYAFAAAILSSCSYFLSMRFQLKARLTERTAEREAEKRAQEDSSD